MMFVMIMWMDDLWLSVTWNWIQRPVGGSTCFSPSAQAVAESQLIATGDR